MALQTALGLWAPLPVALGALVMVAASSYVVAHASRQISYTLFLASLAGFALASAALVVVLFLGAPGLVPETPGRLLLAAGPWAAALFIACLAVYALQHGRALRRGGGGLLSNLLLGAAVLGLAAALFVVRAPALSPSEAVELRLVPAESAVARRARQLAILFVGLDTLREARGLPIGRTTRGGEAAAAAVNPRDAAAPGD
jgi:hypothetical protein